MLGRWRDRIGGQAFLLLSALVVLVVVALAVIIVQHGSTASTAAPAPRQTASVTPATLPHIPVPKPVAPVQRLAGPDAHFDSGAGGWTSPSGSASQIASPAHSGSGALALSTTDPAGGPLAAWSPRESAVGGDRYVGTAWVRAVTATRNVRAVLRFVDATGTTTDTEAGQLVADATTGWVQLPDVAAIAPKGTRQVQLGIEFPVTGAGAKHVVDDASIAQTPGGSSAVVPPLRAFGNQILQGNGKPLVMRGIQRFGLEGGTKTPMPTEAEIAQLKLWGANEVRLSLGEQKWLNTSCHYERAYPQQVDQVVHWVTSRGMVALLNLHFSDPVGCGTPGLTPMADSPGSVTFWQEVASRYADNPLVAFDLFNEPQVDQDTWLDGGPVNYGNRTYQAAGMQQLYDVVRGTGATNLIVVSGLGYAGRPPATDALVQGLNIAYAAHAYTCPNAPPPSCNAPHPYDAAGPLHGWQTFAKSYPVIVTEFGWPNGDDGTYNASVVSYADAHGWGWSGFAWDGSTGGLFDLIQAHPASDGTTIEPNAAGMPLVAGFAKNTLAASSA